MVRSWPWWHRSAARRMQQADQFRERLADRACSAALVLPEDDSTHRVSCKLKAEQVAERVTCEGGQSSCVPLPYCRSGTGDVLVCTGIQAHETVHHDLSVAWDLDRIRLRP